MKDGKLTDFEKDVSERVKSGVGVLLMFYHPHGIDSEEDKILIGVYNDIDRAAASIQSHSKIKGVPDVETVNHYVYVCLNLNSTWVDMKLEINTGDNEIEQ